MPAPRFPQHLNPFDILPKTADGKPHPNTTRLGAWIESVHQVLNNSGMGQSLGVPANSFTARFSGPWAASQQATLYYRSTGHLMTLFIGATPITAAVTVTSQLQISGFPPNVQLPAFPQNQGGCAVIVGGALCAGWVTCGGGALTIQATQVVGSLVEPNNFQAGGGTGGLAGGWCYTYCVD